MSGKCFFDTNIFIYSLEIENNAKCRRATQLIRAAIKTKTGVISYQVIQEFFNVALRRFTKTMTVAEAEQYLNTIFRQLVVVHSSPGLYFEALHLRERYRTSWYDALILAAAVQAECEVLLTEDLQHGQRFGDVRVENPFLSQAL